MAGRGRGASEKIGLVGEQEQFGRRSGRGESSRNIGKCCENRRELPGKIFNHGNRTI